MADSKRYSGPELDEIRNHYWERMTRTRQQATAVRDFLAGKSGITVPENFALTLGDSAVGDLPHKYMGPQRVRQQLISRKVRIRRPLTAVGVRSQTVSSRIEAPLQAIMDDRTAGFPWEDVNDILLLEGLVFTTCATNVEGVPGSPVLYMPGRDDQIERRFRYDAKGRFEDDDGYEGVDLGEARKAHEGELHDYLARRLPFRQKAYSVRQCSPVWGPTMELAGLVIESYWSRKRIRDRGLVVTKDKMGADISPLGAIGEGDSSPHSGSQLRVVEYWYTDEETEAPCVSYSVDGHYTWRGTENGLEPYTVDLSKLVRKKENGAWSGLTRLPISWGWGLGWSAADLDDRALSFVRPFMQSWRNIDALVTMSLAWCQWRAFPALLEEIPLGTPDGSGIDDDNDAAIPDIQPMKITRVRGKISEVATQGIGRDVYQLISLMLGENKAEAGGDQEGAASGFAMSLAQAFEQDAMTTIHDSVKRIYADHGSFVLEGAKALGEKGDVVRVYQISEQPIAQGRPSPVNQLLTLEPDLIGTSFDVDAVSKPVLSPAERQQNAEFVERRLRSKRWELEQDGIEAPEQMLNEITYEDMLDSDQGKAMTLRLLEQFVESEFTRQLQEAISAGEAGPGGLPVGYAQGTTPPPEMLASGVGAPEGGGMPGLGVPNPAEASLMGAIGGGMQTGPINTAVGAGGALPQAPLRGA